jgi:ADP-L-glycero-D-manno-heptose 6-epimerase
MIIVTGANGFIGSALVWDFNQDKFNDLIAVDTVSMKDRPLPLQNNHIKKFLLKNELWAFLDTDEAKKNVSWIIHMGANSSTTETNWEHLLENNVQYSQKIFTWCAENNKGMIYASSASTYGNGDLGYDDATSSEILKPMNLYGESKVQFDRWAVKQSKTPKYWYGLKFFNVYGPNEKHKDSMASVVLKAYEQIQQNSQLKLFKSYNAKFRDGEQMRDFVYVKDITRWMRELTVKTPASGIYNMGFGKARTWVDLGKSVFQALNKPANIEFIEMPDSLKGHYQYYTEAKTTRWEQLGMSKPEWPLERGVADYVQNTLSKDRFYL